MKAEVAASCGDALSSAAREVARRRQHFSVGATGNDELQADGKAGGCQAARRRDCRLLTEIDREGEAAGFDAQRHGRAGYRRLEPGRR